MKQLFNTPHRDDSRKLDFAWLRCSPMAPLRDSNQKQKIMQIYHSSTLPTSRAPEENFTGNVTIGGYFRREAPSRVVSATVTCAPGSRTPWKVNPLGQTLVVLSGAGWAQCQGEEIVEIREGDVVWCPPGRRHWEGATPDQAITYVAIQEFEGDTSVSFGERVTDEEYRKGPSDSS